MAGQTVYFLIFLIIIPRLELWTLASYSTLSYCHKRVAIYYTSYHESCL